MGATWDTCSFTKGRRRARRGPWDVHRALLGTGPAPFLAGFCVFFFLNTPSAWSANKSTYFCTGLRAVERGALCLPPAVDSAGFTAQTHAKMLTLASLLFVVAIAVYLPVLLQVGGNKHTSLASVLD